MLQSSVEQISDRLLSFLERQPSKWPKAIGELGHLSTSMRHKALSQLTAVCRSKDLTKEDRQRLRNELRGFLHNHRSYAEASWSLPTDDLDRLAEVHAALEPEDIVDRHSWLFSSHPQLPEGSGGDWKAEREALDNLRVPFAQNLVDLDESEIVQRMIEAVEQPGTLGFAIGRCAVPGETTKELIEYCLAKDESDQTELFLRGFVGAQSHTKGEDWTKTLLNRDWSETERARIASGLPFEGKTWSLLTAFGADQEREYWRRTPAFTITDAVADGDTAIKGLLSANRHFTAISLAGLTMKGQATPISTELIVEMLMEAPKHNPREEAPPADLSLLGYNIEHLLDILTTGDMDRSQLAKLEWGWLPALEYGHRPPDVLHEELSTDPRFFAEVISFVFRADDDNDDRESNETTQAMARLGYALLRSWHRVPGTGDEGKLDGVALKDWVTRARQACSERKRVPHGDQYIGQVLAFSPSGEDGAWPAEPVRDLLESFRNREIEVGISIGIYNKRGTYSKPVGEGGKQELELAAQYRSYADTVQDRWPRTGGLLRKVANDYERQARGEDIRRDQEGW